MGEKTGELGVTGIGVTTDIKDTPHKKSLLNVTHHHAAWWRSKVRWCVVSVDNKDSLFPSESFYNKGNLLLEVCLNVT